MTRAVVAVLWVAGFFAALHGRQVLTGSDIPLLVGLLLAAYPVIDAAAALAARRDGAAGPEANVAIVIGGSSRRRPTSRR